MECDGVYVHGTGQGASDAEQAKEKQEMTGWVVAAAVVVAVLAIVIAIVWKMLASISDIEIGDIDLDDGEADSLCDCNSVAE